MSVEHGGHQPERNAERTNNLEQAARERMAELQNTNHEADPQKSAESRAEAAREVIHGPEANAEPEPAPAEPKSAPKIPFLSPHLNYAHTMAGIRQKLSPAARRVSAIIHTPVIEKTSEALEHTVARPSVVNGALWTALLVGGIFYVSARTYGYALSGSEMLFSLVVGAIIGVAIEAVWRAFKH